MVQCLEYSLSISNVSAWALIYELGVIGSSLLVLCSTSRGSFLGTFVFPSHQKPKLISQ